MFGWSGAQLWHLTSPILRDICPLTGPPWGSPPPLPMCIGVAPCCKRIVSSHFFQFSTLWRKGDFSIQRNETVIARGRGCRRHYQGVEVEVAGCKKIFFARGRWCRRHYQGVGGIRCWSSRVQNHFSDRTLFFDLQFKNTSNLILLGFKMSSERFLFKDFKKDLTFWNMWI